MGMMQPAFNYSWSMDDGYPAAGIEPNGLKVFSTFSCGGGSTMGYKLAGYTVIGCNEIDPQMMRIYKANHSPRLSYQMPIAEFNQQLELNPDLSELDILDGSPPCSSFSLNSPRREKWWGKEKKFREGQAKQRLDDLFFDYLETVARLRPKVAIAENVKGLVSGNAKRYLRKVLAEFKSLGYSTQVFLLNAARMGVPQVRERVFVIANRMQYKPIKLEFNLPPIPYREYQDGLGPRIKGRIAALWNDRQYGDKNLGDVVKRLSGRHAWFSWPIVYPDTIVKTLIASTRPTRYDCPNEISLSDFCHIGSFPQDYDFQDAKPHYIIGMSVPPVMMAQIAYQVSKQWFNS